MSRNSQGAQGEQERLPDPAAPQEQEGADERELLRTILPYRAPTVRTSISFSTQ
jgi:hypothetical protein